VQADLCYWSLHRQQERGLSCWLGRTWLHCFQPRLANAVKPAASCDEITVPRYRIHAYSGGALRLIGTQGCQRQASRDVFQGWSESLFIDRWEHQRGFRESTWFSAGSPGSGGVLALSLGHRDSPRGNATSRARRSLSQRKVCFFAINVPVADFRQRLQTAPRHTGAEIVQSCSPGEAQASELGFHVGERSFCPISATKSTESIDRNT